MIPHDLDPLFGHDVGTLLHQSLAECLFLMDHFLDIAAERVWRPPRDRDSPNDLRLMQFVHVRVDKTFVIPLHGAEILVEPDHDPPLFCAFRQLLEPFNRIGQA